MSCRAYLYLAVVVLTLTTANIHLLMGVTSLADPSLWPLNGLWLLNGVGYLVLMAFGYVRVYRSYLVAIPRDTAQILLIAYTALTIAAYLALSGPPTPLAVITKLAEALLIAAIILHRREIARQRDA